jgi:hypothetical protein
MMIAAFSTVAAIMSDSAIWQEFACQKPLELLNIQPFFAQSRSSDPHPLKLSLMETR